MARREPPPDPPPQSRVPPGRGGSMPRIIAYNNVTADGFFASSDGSLNWVVPDAQLDHDAEAGMKTAGAVLFGRKTFDIFEAFWPNVLKPGAVVRDPHRPDNESPHIRAVATWLRDARKYVFSRTKKGTSWENTEILRDFTPRRIAELKGGYGLDIMIFGSGSLTSQLAHHGLIDEYQFVVYPVFIGNGRSLLSGLIKQVKLALREVKSYSSGTVLHRYSSALM